MHRLVVRSAQVTLLLWGAEFAGQGNEGQRNFRGGKCRTGKWRKKVQGWKMQEFQPCTFVRHFPVLRSLAVATASKRGQLTRRY